MNVHGMRVCAAACTAERLDILKWARESGCPWDVSAYQAAVNCENEEILQYLKENGCLMEESVPPEEREDEGS